MAPEGWFPKLEAWCRRRDILLIIDEVQASFGRTGKLFGFQHYGITPNLLCLGKGISSSVPLSAIVGEGRIMDSPDPRLAGLDPRGERPVRAGWPWRTSTSSWRRG